VSADLDIQAQTAAPAEKKLWQEPRLTCLALNQTATGNFIEAPEGGIFEFLFCGDNPDCVITFPS